MSHEIINLKCFLTELFNYVYGIDIIHGQYDELERILNTRSRPNQDNIPELNLKV